MQSYSREGVSKGLHPTFYKESIFFLVKKKVGGLRSCIDYRSLNDVTVKYSYPLPLAPASLEQRCTAWFFTKLDLRSSHNLIRSRAGDEWKTTFSITAGH